jgi:hypothetical protein
MRNHKQPVFERFIKPILGAIGMRRQNKRKILVPGHCICGQNPDNGQI